MHCGTSFVTYCHLFIKIQKVSCANVNPVQKRGRSGQITVKGQSVSQKVGTMPKIPECVRILIIEDCFDNTRFVL